MMALISKPLCLYRAITDFKHCMIVGICLFGRASTVPNFRFLEVVTKNAILLINIISIARIIERCILKISGGTPSIPMATCGFGRHTVFPFSDPRFGPKMSSAAVMSDLFIGQSLRCVIAISIMSRFPGLITIFWKRLAVLAN